MPAAGQQSVRVGRPAVVLEGTEQGIDVKQISGGDSQDDRTRRVPDQIVALRIQVAREIRGALCSLENAS